MYASPIIYPSLTSSKKPDVCCKGYDVDPIAQILQDMRHFIIDPVNPRGWDIINNKLICFCSLCDSCSDFYHWFPCLLIEIAKRFAEIL